MTTTEHIGRIAHHVARLVHADPGQTPGGVARQLAAKDRPSFVDSTVYAIGLELIRVESGRLHPGRVAPNPPRVQTSAALTAALKTGGLL
jgi:hypothetical protein